VVPPVLGTKKKPVLLALRARVLLEVVRVVDQVLLVMVPHQATWESDGCDMQRLRSGVGF